jgi:hypothetical protein
MPSKEASYGGLRPDPIGDMGAKVALPGESLGQCFAKFTWPPLAHDVASAPTTPTGTDTLATFSRADAPSADLST